MLEEYLTKQKLRTFRKVHSYKRNTLSSKETIVSTGRTGDKISERPAFLRPPPPREQGVCHGFYYDGIEKHHPPGGLNSDTMTLPGLSHGLLSSRPSPNHDVCTSTRLQTSVFPPGLVTSKDETVDLLRLTLVLTTKKIEIRRIIFLVSGTLNFHGRMETGDLQKDFSSFPPKIHHGQTWIIVGTLVVCQVLTRPCTVVLWR